MSIADGLRVRKEDLLENPTNRVPVALCLDVSGSMAGEPMRELNDGVEQFFAALRQDPVARHSAEVALVAFADHPGVVLDFQSLDRVLLPPRLATGSALGISTDLGGGVALALDVLEMRKREYKDTGVDYFQPFLVLMTDGQPTTEAHRASAPRVCALEQQNKLVVMPIGIGAHADLGTLTTFSHKRKPLRLKGLSFVAFFKWLSRSVVRVSQSMPGERVALPTEGISGWGEI
jgi:uncharacterized protein YegL